LIAYAFFSLFAALTGVYVLFLLRMRAGLRFIAQQHSDGERPSSEKDLPVVTVLVPMRNEEDQIRGLVSSLRGQDYAPERTEVLLLDDHSDDGTARHAAEAIGGDARFRILPIAGTGKKAAITEGVHASRGEIVVTTDADCRHAAGWLAAMAAPFRDGADIVAGPVVYDDRRTLFQRFQAMEFLGLMGVGAGFFGIGYPRLCNGANLAYRRAMFTTVSGFEGNAHVQSGDDEFLLHKIIYRQGGVGRFTAHPDALVRTAAAPTVRSFLQQRVRWASKGRSYDDGRFVSFLVLLFIYMLFAAAAPFVSFASGPALLAGILFFAVKVIADATVLYSAAALFRQPLRIPDLVAAEFLHAYYLVSVSIIGFFGGYTWKDRRIRSREQ